MSVDQPTRGRPPGPSLATEAVHVFRRNAFAALRGPNSRGAVPRSAFDQRRCLHRRPLGEEGVPGRHGQDPLRPGLPPSEPDGRLLPFRPPQVFEAVEESFRQTDDMEATLRVFLMANYLNGCTDEGYLAALVIQLAACAHLESGNNELPKQTAAAEEVVERRRQMVAAETDGYIAGLAIALRRLRRRPRAALHFRDIVLAVTVASEGATILYKLQPDAMTADLVVDTLVQHHRGPDRAGAARSAQRTESDRTRVGRGGTGDVLGRSRTLLRAGLSQACGVPVEEILDLFPTEGASRNGAWTMRWGAPSRRRPSPST